ncbi:MAG: hypothetical protein WAQ53_12660 [Thiofilum sp.]|uniref:hypothetical protein n=1 Tax=Thiofilum sp. TaxID=2212733 RepID=UPI0025FE5467|nr:hypothetical protein [Thiofilum sp.]MBK8454372.1 hypothetical protein [Thiofilum sp.]
MTPELLYSLRDVAGVPSHPLVFLILGVVTFALHIIAVQVLVGASALVLWGALSSSDYPRRLAQTLLVVAKVAVSVAVVLGVAPLLFVQVTYDPFWYTSNVLSAWWVIGFIVILTLAYLLLYYFYYRNHHLATQPTSSIFSLMVSLVLFWTVGFIMHTLTYQMLSPDQWMQWYAPNQTIDASGTKLHSYHLARYGFFMLLGLPVIGCFIIAYRQYVSECIGIQRDYLHWLRVLGMRLMLSGGGVVLVVGAIWVATTPSLFTQLLTQPLSWLAVALLVLVSVAPTLLNRKLNSVWGSYGLVGLIVLTVLVIATVRELERFAILKGKFGYNTLDYKVNVDWYSTTMFFVTFALVGGSTLAYYLMIAWQAGRTEGIYTPSPALSRLGNWVIGMMVVWIVHFFVLGFWVWWR